MINDNTEAQEIHPPLVVNENPAAELRLSGVVRKLLEISEDSDDEADLGSNVYFDSESLMIQACNDGVEYKFWFGKLRNSSHCYVKEVEIDAAVTGVDFKRSGDGDDILSILANCLSGEQVREDLEPVTWAFAK